jgi:hypothetical protein
MIKKNFHIVKRIRAFFTRLRRPKIVCGDGLVFIPGKGSYKITMIGAGGGSRGSGTVESKGFGEKLEQSRYSKSRIEVVDFIK